MLYTYSEFPGHLIITYSDIEKDKNGNEYLYVNFEQPTDFGFKEARYILPGFKLINNEDFPPDELDKNVDILKHNKRLIWSMARKDGNLFD